ncbi:MAG TPA: biotin--[acetyl-CoA-carboxylase] ligase [Rhodopila sp.]|uniref:biotin--[acetyl-CoA-carboxylase] ligase n=1 Tax=Rhodopila sp. TaxID=2480087 RepID=UPI002BAC743C|nr:biotin--[acetyl-CoA-carboxylase] ligase [Rhodopila sp.]HVY14459.1 biotin--[acetyl-CoA-carboxylase] ligase [Rhodopila sp.]
MTSGFTIRHYDTIGSTNDELRRLAAEGAGDGTVVHADEQTSGRGRMARSWFSPPGNLYMSILMRTGLPTQRSSELGFLTAIAVAETVRALVPAKVPVVLKWPNDVLAAEAKISGILVEQAEAAVIVGIGLNILEAPSSTGYRTTTVAAQGGIATVDGARDLLLTRFRRLADLWTEQGFGPIRQAWLGLSYPVGAEIKFTGAEGPIAGQFAGLDTDGALLLNTPEGQLRFLAGDVSV